MVCADSNSRSSSAVFLLTLAGIALSYYLTGRFGLQIYITEGAATLIWLPSGIALSAVLLLGFRVWPGIFIGALLVNYHQGLPWHAAGLIASGNTLESLCAAFLLHRYGGLKPLFHSIDSSLRFILLACVLATTVSASIGVAVLGGFEVVEQGRLLHTWLLWWLGDFMAVLLVTPLLLSWISLEERAAISGQYAQIWLLLLITAVVSLWVYGPWLFNGVGSRLIYLTFPLVVWGTMRHGQLIGISLCAIIATVAIWGTLQGGGLAVKDEVNESLIYLYVFVFVVASSVLLISSLVSERRLLLQQLRLAQGQALRDSERKSEFLANISHEIRTPMNGILGITELLLDEPKSDRQRHQLATIYQSGQGLLEILNDVLDYSKIEAGRLQLEPKPFSLSRLLAESQLLFQKNCRDKNLQFTLDIDTKLCDFFSGDAGRIRQVINNLLSNAIKFTERGSISVTAQCLSEQAGEFTVLIRVADTGIGIEKSKLRQIFMPYTQADSSTTRRFGGTGLGLSISQQLVQLMGGSLQLNSSVGQGTTVELSLRLSSCAEFDYEHFQSSNTSALKSDGELSLNILLAEDNPVNQMVARGMLDRLGHSVTLAADGQQALTLWTQQDFDLILMDCHMPEMDGYSATRSIRMQEHERGDTRIPIVALTANAMKKHEQSCYDAGMDAYLSKPLTVEALSQVLAKYHR